MIVRTGFEVLAVAVSPWSCDCHWGAWQPACIYDSCSILWSHVTICKFSHWLSISKFNGKGDGEDFKLFPLPFLPRSLLHACSTPLPPILSAHLLHHSYSITLVYSLWLIYPCSVMPTTHITPCFLPGILTSSHLMTHMVQGLWYH